MDADVRARNVYLPFGANWTEVLTGKVYIGGQMAHVDAPLKNIPLFVRDGSTVLDLINK